MELTLETKVKLINKRIGWKTMRSQLGKQLGVTAQGADLFINKILASSDKKIEYNNTIDAFWKNLVLGGAHYLRVFKLNEEQSKKAENLFKLQIPDSSFNEIYPYPLQHEDLEKAPMVPTLVDKQTLTDADTSVHINIYCNKSFYTSIEDLESSFLTEEGRELRNSGAEITCKKRYTVQCYNFIAYDSIHNELLLCVDGSQLPRVEAKKEFAALFRLLPKELMLKLSDAINYFSCVENLYSTQDGYIQNVGFLTPDGGTSNMKIKSTGTCVRHDTYHKGGEDAAKILTKFKLTKAWLVASTSNKISVFLPGTRFMLDDPSKKLDEICTKNCLGVHDTLFLLNKIRVAV